MSASLSVAGKILTNLKAYETRCTECTNVNHPNQPRKSNRFNGYYWDVSTALKQDADAAITLTVDSKYVPLVQGLFFENTETVLEDGYLV